MSIARLALMRSIHKANVSTIKLRRLVSAQPACQLAVLHQPPYWPAPHEAGRRPLSLDRPPWAQSTIPATAFGDTVPLGHYVTVTDRTVQHAFRCFEQFVSYVMRSAKCKAQPSRREQPPSTPLRRPRTCSSVHLCGEQAGGDASAYGFQGRECSGPSL
jgi:hypothetical protein